MNLRERKLTAAGFVLGLFAGAILVGLIVAGALGLEQRMLDQKTRALVGADAQLDQAQAMLRATIGERNALADRFTRATVLYEPCSLTVAGGLASVQPGPVLTAAGVPQCAAWVIPADVQPRRWGAAPGGLILTTDRMGHPIGNAGWAPRMPGFEAYGAPR